MWIWFGVKLLQSSNTHQNERSHSRKLSSASWRKDDVSLVRFLIWPANNKKKPTSYENTPCLAWNRFGLPLIVALLLICSSQSVQHIQVVVNSHYSLNELELFCFLIDRRRLSPFKTFHSTILSTRMNHCARLRCEHLIIGFAFCSLVCCSSAIAVHSCRQDVNNTTINKNVRIWSTRMKSSRSFTMRYFKIIGFAFCSLVCCTSVTAVRFLQLLQWRVGTGLLKLTRCTCWGCQCAVKRVKRKASRPNDSWIENAKTVMPCLYPRVRMIVTADIKMRGGRFTVMNQANQRDYVRWTCRPDHRYFEAA